MLWAVLIALLVMAMGGFGHTGYRRGWYGNYNQGDYPVGGWRGLRIGIVLLVLAALLFLARLHPLGVSQS